MKNNEHELLSWIQNWYFQYCDGDWEHNENINIQTIDNPGWHATIDLEKTDCENNWFHCFVINGKFEGAGGPCNLIEILEIFKEWVITTKGKE